MVTSTPHLLSLHRGMGQLRLMVVLVFTRFVLFGEVTGQTGGEVSACMGNQGIPCTALALTCDPGRRVFPISAYYGYSPVAMNCPTPVSFEDGCPNSSCCNKTEGSCLKPYVTSNWRLVYRTHGCWNVSQCSTLPQWTNGGCGGGGAFNSVSNFVTINYACLQASETMEFSTSRTVEASAVLLHFSSPSPFSVPRGSTRTWYCHLAASDCSNALADVTLVKESNRLESACTSLSEDGSSYLPCDDEDSSYRSLVMTLPFNVYLRVAGSDVIDSAWGIVRGRNGAQLKVSCGFTMDGTEVPPSCNETLIPTTPGSRVDNSTVLPSEGSLNSGSVAGIVVALLLLAICAIAVFVYWKRRNIIPWCKNFTNTVGGSIRRIPLSTKSTSSTMTMTSQKRDVTPQQSNASHVMVTADVTAKPGDDVSPADEDAQAIYDELAEVDCEYDRLGQIKKDSLSEDPRNPYHHLGSVTTDAENPEDAYNHVIRHGPGDVIDNVNGADNVPTAAGSADDEGDQNVVILNIIEDSDNPTYNLAESSH